MIRWISYGAAVFGFAGTFLTWLAIGNMKPSDNVTDPSNLHAQLFLQYGCGLDCIKTIQGICIFLLFIGGIGVLIDVLSNKRG